MPHTGRYGDLDYSRWAKRTFLLGVALFLAGAVGEGVLTAVQVSVPQWTHTVLVDLEIAGVLVALLLPLLFGIVLPLTE